MNRNLPGSQASAKSDAVDQHGGALRQSRMVPPRWETATVLDYFPNLHAYTVKGSISGILDHIPRLLQDPGETVILPRGTVVAVHDELGYPVIASVLSSAVLSGVSLNPTKLTEVPNIGGDDPVYAADKGAGYCPPDAPTDTLSGDWVRRSPDGNLLGVLAGGLNVLQSAPMAQIRTHALGELVEILSTNYKHITSMGDFRIQNKEGKTSLIWRAGSDQSDETGANRGHWSIRLDVGATGDLFTFEVTTPEGQSLCRVHMSADGKLELLGVAGIDLTSGNRGPMREDIAGDHDSEVFGNQTENVKGSVGEYVGGTRDTSISKDDGLTVGNNLRETIAGDRNVYVGGKIRQAVQGGATPSLYEYIDGPVEVSAPSQTYVSSTGGANFVGLYNVICTQDDGVKLGADAVVTPSTDGSGHSIKNLMARYHAMKYEPWYTVMSALLDWLDQHQHLTAMGPTGPALSAATASVKLKVTPQMVSDTRSKRVAIGN